MEEQYIDKSLTVAQIDELNDTIYQETLDALGFDSEEDYYRSLRRISRTDAIAYYCKHTCCCMNSGQIFTKAEMCPSRKENKRLVAADDEEFCPLAYWNEKGNKHIPKKNYPKVTQKQALAFICKKCQSVLTLDKNVRRCAAFWTGDKHDGGCPVHPYRTGANPWYLSDFSEEEREAKQQAAIERMEACREKGD